MVMPVISQHVDVQVQDVPIDPGRHVNVVPQVVLGTVKLPKQGLHIKQMPSRALSQGSFCSSVQLVHVLLVDANMRQRDTAVGIRARPPGPRRTCAEDEHCVLWHIGLQHTTLEVKVAPRPAWHFMAAPMQRGSMQ